MAANKSDSAQALQEKGCEDDSGQRDLRHRYQERSAGAEYSVRAGHCKLKMPTALPWIKLAAGRFLDDLRPGMRVIRQCVLDEDFREALDRAPPGIIDPRVWADQSLSTTAAHN